MTKTGLIFLILNFCFCTVLFANEEIANITFKDSFGIKWKRWVSVDRQQGRTIVTVFEDPLHTFNQRYATQVIVDRIVLLNPSEEVVQSYANHYLLLKDLPFRSTRTYHNEIVGLQNRTPNPLWVPVKNYWTLDDEQKFSEWFKTKASATMAQGAGLEFDCADFGLLGRWIFAHDNKLPIANTLAGSGKLFGHFSESKSWSHLPTHDDWKQDQRFKAALKYLFLSTFTRSLQNDLYPIQINKEFLTAGSIILTLRPNSGHTQVIYGVGHSSYCGTECLMVLYGNEPARDYGYLAQASFKNHTQAEGGFLRWRWPILKNGKWQLLEKATMPGYSLEQYQKPNLGYDEFYDYVYESLGFNIPPVKKAMSLARGLQQEIYERLEITALGAMYCHYQFCDPQGVTFDQYSTPSKDARWREKRDQFLRLFAQLKRNEQVDIQNYFRFSVFNLGLSLSPTFWEYLGNVGGISDRMSADPSYSYTERWGMFVPSNLQKLSSMLTMFSNQWQFRQRLVIEAVKICNDGKEPLVCDSNSNDVQKLSTLQIDNVLKKIDTDVDQIFATLSRDEQRDALKTANRMYLHQGCSENLNGNCFVTDYLLSNKNLIHQISSDPTHSFRRRVGLE